MKKDALHLIFKPNTMNTKNIHEKIYEIRGQKVMLDFDLAQLYEVETKVFNQAVKRNSNRFPEDFMFRLTAEEWEHHMELWTSSQIVTTSDEADADTLLIDNQPIDGSSQIVMTSQKSRGKANLPYGRALHGGVRRRRGRMRVRGRRSGGGWWCCR
jgi:ORF6N domain